MPEKLIVQVATVLNEPDHRLLARMLATMGEARFVGLVQQTLDSEASGGQMIADGRRRRSPGGVLCQLVKGCVNEQEKRLIFSRAARRQIQTIK